jgi:hypothetical protein
MVASAPPAPLVRPSKSLRRCITLRRLDSMCGHRLRGLTPRAEAARAVRVVHEIHETRRSQLDQRHEVAQPDE